MSKRKQDVLVEEFSIPEDQGAAAFMMGLQKPGYIFDRLERKGKNVKVYFIKKNDPLAAKREKERLEEKENALDGLALQYDTVKALWVFWAGVVLPQMRQLPSIIGVDKERLKQVKVLEKMETDFVKRFSREELDEEKFHLFNNPRKRIEKRKLTNGYQLPEDLIEHIKKDLHEYAISEKVRIDNLVDRVLKSAMNLCD